MLSFINKFLAKVTIFLIKIYQFTISPDKWLLSFRLKWKICIHTPHCSQYWTEVLKRYWFIPWIFMAMERISQCHPWNDNNYDPPFYKIIFFSSAPIGCPFLESLKNDNRFELQGVVTMPDKPAWRWLKIQENIIKTKAKELGINNIQTPDNIRPKNKQWEEFIKWLNIQDADFFVVIAYGKIIPQVILDIPKLWPINVHWSILPKYRGASPIQSVLLENEKETGITIMLMNAKMDEWDMINIQKFPIKFERTAMDIIDQIMRSWPKFLNKTLFEYGKKYLLTTPQDHLQATYCKKIEKTDWLIDISKQPLWYIYSHYRAYFLWPKLWFELWENKKRVIIETMKLNENMFEENKNWLIIQDLKTLTLNPAIVELTVKPEGKKSMSWNEFSKGYMKYL